MGWGRVLECFKNALAKDLEKNRFGGCICGSEDERKRSRWNQNQVNRCNRVDHLDKCQVEDEKNVLGGKLADLEF
jgi:hypothetical protein